MGQEMEIQWNPVNPTTNGPAKSGRINGVVKGFLNKKMTERTSVRDKRKWLYQRGGRINGVVVLTGWS